jgi:hypothetical protein
MLWVFRPSEPLAIPFSLELICLEFIIIISTPQITPLKECQKHLEIFYTVFTGQNRILIKMTVGLYKLNFVLSFPVKVHSFYTVIILLVLITRQSFYLIIQFPLSDLINLQDFY